MPRTHSHSTGEVRVARRLCKEPPGCGAERSHRHRNDEKCSAGSFPQHMDALQTNVDTDYELSFNRSLENDSCDLQSITDSITRARVEADLDVPMHYSVQANWSGSGGRRKAHKQAREMTQSLKQSEANIRLLQEERDSAVHELMSLSGKVMNCTSVAEEQAKLLEEQSNTICTMKNKIQMLEKTKEGMQEEHMEKVHALERISETSRAEAREQIQNLENTIMKLREEQKDIEKKLLKVETENQEVKKGLLKLQGGETDHQKELNVLELKEYIEKIRLYEQSSCTLLDEQHELRAKIRALEEDNQQLMSEQRLNADVRASKLQKLHDYESLGKRLKSDRDDYKQKTRSLESSNLRMQEEAKESIKVLQHVGDENERLVFKQKVMEEEIQSADHNNRILQLQNDELKKLNQRLEDHNHSLELEFKDYILKHEVQEKERKRLETQIQVTQQRAVVLESTVQRLQQENTMLQEGITSFENPNQQVRHKYEEEIQNLENLSAQTESQLNKRIAALEEEVEHLQSILKEKTKIIRDRDQEYKEEILAVEEQLKDIRTKHKCEMAKLKTSNQEIEGKFCKEIITLKSCAEDVEKKHKEVTAALKEKIYLYQQRAVIQDDKIKKVQYKLEVAKTELAKEKRKMAELKESLENQETANKKKLKELRAASNEIQNLTSSNTELREQAETIDQLWVDNARLVQLLAESEEYQKLLAEMEESNGLVFSPSQFKGSKFQVLAQRYGALSTRASVNPKTEIEHWIPGNLYDLVMTFRREHSWDVAIEELHQLLRLVNTFWQEREKKHMVQTRMKYERKLSTLKRHQLQRMPYQHVVRSSQLRSAGKMTLSSSSKVSLDEFDQEGLLQC